MFEFLQGLFSNFSGNGSGYVGLAGEDNLLAKAIAHGQGMGAFYATVIIAIIVAYLVGNISPATLLGKAKGIDIKKEGSGNAGTTNVARVLGKKAAIITLLIDVCKGMLVVIVGRAVGGDFLAMITVLPVLLGHIWPVVFRFKGGKGVATAFGALVMLNPLIGFGELLVVLLGVLISRRMSIGSFAGCIGLPILTYFIMPAFFADSLCMAIIVFFKHRSNLIRVIHGQEPPISFGHADKKGDSKGVSAGDLEETEEE